MRARWSPRSRHGLDEQGVTLIELMVVVAIIALLAVAFLAAFRSARASAIDGRAVDFLDQLRRVMALYSARNGQYPVPAGITNNQPNAGPAAYQALATELQALEPNLPIDLNDAPVAFEGPGFVYYPSADPDPMSANTFTIVARPIGGTGVYFCADPSGVVSLGNNPTPATPGASCTGAGNPIF